MKWIINFTLVFAGWAGILLDSIYGYESVGNVTIFSYWILIVLGILAVLLTPAKDIYKGTKTMRKTRGLLSFITVLIMIYFGWFVTGVFYMLTALAFKMKVDIYLDVIKEKHDANTMQS